MSAGIEEPIAITVAGELKLNGLGIILISKGSEDSSSNFFLFIFNYIKQACGAPRIQ